MKKVIALALLLAAQAAGAEPTPEQDARYRALIGELRCLVCQNQSIADSNAPLAADLREQVLAQIQAGRSDAQIHDYLTARYGDFVLYRPPFKERTWLLWVGPFALLLVVALFVSLFIRRSRPPAIAPADPAALKKLLDEEKAGQ